MKLELLIRPAVELGTIGRNFDVSTFDSTKRKIGDVVDVLDSKLFAVTQHVHYVFYFHLPPDTLSEILCYTRLRVSREQLNHDEDEGLLSGSLEEFYQAAYWFCQKGMDKMLRAFFNILLVMLENESNVIPFNKTDLGDKTFALRNNNAATI